MYFFKATEQIARLGSHLLPSSRFSSLSLRGLSRLLLLLLLPVLSASAAESIVLSSDQSVSTAGYYQLSWEMKNASPGTVYTLEQATEDAEKAEQIYRGSDTATMITGKPDGRYHYIVRTDDGSSSSNPLTVTVAHHSLATAFNFFIIGVVVFIFILIAIILGNRQQAKHQ